jgi:hypothetical protein
LEVTAGAAGALAIDPRILRSLQSGEPIKRAIPSTGETIPAVGLGSSATFSQLARAGDLDPLTEGFRTLVEGGASVSYFDPDTARDDPLARKLFQVDGVDSLLIAEDFVTVTKSPTAEWDDLVPKIETVIKEVLS